MCVVFVVVVLSPFPSISSLYPIMGHGGLKTVNIKNNSKHLYNRDEKTVIEVYNRDENTVIEVYNRNENTVIEVYNRHENTVILV